MYTPPMDSHKIPSIIQGAEPFFYPGGEVGCLLLHGIAASPAEVRWTGKYLAEQGYTVYGPRLAGHGADYRLLRHTRWQNWFMTALDGYHLLRSHCSRVYIVGLSTGALLTLLLASVEEPDGIIPMAAPVRVPTMPSFAYLHLMKYIRPFTDQTDRTDFPERLKAEQRRRGEAELGRVRYSIWATKGVEELARLMKTVDTHLSGVHAPALLIYSEKDATVPLDNLDYVRQRISSRVIETLVVKRSGHILTQDYDYEEVQARIVTFIKDQEETRQEGA